MRTIDAIVVHCSDTPDTLDVGASAIRQWHTAPKPTPAEAKWMKENPDKPPPRAFGNGWRDIAYHYVVRRSGEIEVGRMESAIGAHTATMNGRSIGVCWVGRETQTEEQHAALVKLVRELMQRYGVPLHRVFGHREADPGAKKTCPNMDMIEFRTEVGQ